MPVVKFLSILLSVSVLSACLEGGISGSGSSPQEQNVSSESGHLPEIRTGYFVDAPVKGVHYKTETREGATNFLGRFEYRAAETVTFSIGATVLGSVPAQPLLTPAELDASGTLEGNRATNIGRLLITLDADQNPYNGIDIDQRAHDAFAGTAFDLSKPPSELENLEVFNQALNDAGRERLVSIQTAHDHMAYTASRLPEKPTDLNIYALLDMSPNYRGQRSPITPTPDNFRQAAQVFWADPETPGLDFYWLRQWVDTDLFHDLAKQHLQGDLLPEGITVTGTVNGYDGIDDAELEITFDGHQHGSWLISGSAVVLIEASEFGISFGQYGEEGYEYYDFDGFNFDLELDDVKFSNDSATFGLHGQVQVGAVSENPDINLEAWSLDVVLHKVRSKQIIKITTDRPIWYSEHRGQLEEEHGYAHSLSFNGEILHGQLGAYLLTGTLDYNEQMGVVSNAQFDFLESVEQPLGTLKAIVGPDSLDFERRVRAEVTGTAEGANPAFEVYALETPLTGRRLEPSGPIWVFDFIRYEVVKDNSVPPNPTQVRVTLPPIAMDPDGETLNTELSWLIGQERLPAGKPGSLPLILNLDPEQQTTDTEVCIRTTESSGRHTLIQDVAINLSKEGGVEHKVLWDDAPCLISPG